MKSNRVEIEDFYFDEKECMYNIEAIINYQSIVSPETESTPCFSENQIDSIEIETIKVYVDIINDYIELKLTEELIDTVVNWIDWDSHIE